MRRVTAWSGALGLAFVGACDPPPTPAVDAAADAPCRYCTPTCPSPDEAPLAGDDGGVACTRVGAIAAADDAAWPDPSTAATPIAYVGLADGPRTPQGDAPLPDLASALARMPPPATVFVGAGSYALSAALRVTAAVTIRGVGSERTVVVGAPNTDAIVVAPTGSVPVAVSLAGLAVRFADAGGAGVGLRVTGAHTTLALRDVAVRRAGEGLRVESGATLCAEAVSVREAARFGVTLSDDAHGYLRGVVVRDGAGVGVAVLRSHLALDTGLVADNARDGVVLSGTVTGESCDPSVGCAAVPACAGFVHERACVASLAVPAHDGIGAIAADFRCRSVSVLARVAVLRNQVTGLRAERSGPSADEAADDALRYAQLAAPGPSVRAERIVVAGTRVPAGTVGGYGVFVGPTSSVAFDLDISSEAEQGTGSRIVDNANAGVLVDGDPSDGDAGLVVGDVAIPDALARAGTLSMAGALVGSNRGPGAFVQRRAVAERVAFSVFDDNAIMAFGVSAPGALALGLCDQFIGTRDGSFAAATAGSVQFHMGDGVAFSDPTPSRPEVWRPMVATLFADSVFSRNARAGVLLGPGEITFQTSTLGNRGSDNEYGVVANGARITGDVSAIRGRTASPDTLRGTAGDYARSSGR